jgi:single-strand DNA-binding protein
VNETIVTIVGNLTADPELRFTPSGAAVANFTIASTPRVKDGDAWKDGQPLFLNCSVWREAAENATESLKRGSRVIASGRLKQRSYETRDGEKRTVVELDVEEIGPSLRYARASIEKTSSKPQKPAPAAADDPWGSAPAVGDDGLPPF